MTDRNEQPQDDAAMEGVLRRVQKMLAIANDPRADANEAAAMAKAAENIMRKFQLDNAAILAHQLKTSSGSIVVRHVFANMKRDVPNRPAAVKNPSWGQHLAVALARLNNCEVRQGFAQNKFGVYCACLSIYGYSADVQLTEWTFDYLVGSLINAVQGYSDQHKKDYGYGPDKVTSDAFRRGFTDILNARINSEAASKTRDLIGHTAGTALMVIKNEKIVEQFGEFGYRDTKQAEVRDKSAYRDGILKGKEVDIHRRGVEGGSGTKLLN